jgi:hypothetical protein
MDPVRHGDCISSISAVVEFDVGFRGEQLADCDPDESLVIYEQDDDPMGATGARFGVKQGIVHACLGSAVSGMQTRTSIGIQGRRLQMPS